ncbi:hypothetical protein ACTXT7_004941 [Hymenolepis weldensis]
MRKTATFSVMGCQQNKVHICRVYGSSRNYQFPQIVSKSPIILINTWAYAAIDNLTIICNGVLISEHQQKLDEAITFIKSGRDSKRVGLPRNAKYD